ncbi:MAG TPA: hypothetical protein VED85_04855 [Burkholderiaceae bacterium]|nr:hypothetical protein [Burkholderiaceae bacterium]
MTRSRRIAREAALGSLDSPVFLEKLAPTVIADYQAWTQWSLATAQTRLSH